MIKGEELPTETKVLLSEKQIKTRDADMYIRKEVTGWSGTHELLVAGTKQVFGETNWNGNRLPKYENLVLERIRAGYAFLEEGEGMGEVDPLANPLIRRYTNLLEVVDPSLLNADLIIRQNDNILVEIPVERLFSEAKSDRPAGTLDAYEIDNPPILKEEIPVQLQLRVPEGASIDGKVRHFFELHLIGQKTRKVE